jgi:hypothetical protein
VAPKGAGSSPVGHPLKLPANIRKINILRLGHRGFGSSSAGLAAESTIPRLDLKALVLIVAPRLLGSEPIAIIRLHWEK